MNETLSSIIIYLKNEKYPAWQFWAMFILWYWFFGLSFEKWFKRFELNVTFGILRAGDNSYLCFCGFKFVT